MDIRLTPRPNSTKPVMFCISPLNVPGDCIPLLRSSHRAHAVDCGSFSDRQEAHSRLVLPLQDCSEYTWMQAHRTTVRLERKATRKGIAFVNSASPKKLPPLPFSDKGICRRRTSAHIILESASNCNTFFLGLSYCLSTVKVFSTDRPVLVFWTTHMADVQIGHLTFFPQSISFIKVERYR